MRATRHWPLHPHPKEGEAMSSWLHRVATCYQLDMRLLLEHDLGHGRISDLDSSLPLALLTLLAQRSGFELDLLRCMSLAGWVPWLLDSLDDSIPSSLDTYAFQFSVLLSKKRRKKRSVSRWRAWIPPAPIQRACPLCLKNPDNEVLLLAWTLPLMLSCPVHGCWLESFFGLPGLIFSWVNYESIPRMASDKITMMDRRTWQALTAGHVELPRRRIHAGVWFRLLRTLLEELNTPLSQCGPCAESIRHIWEYSGYVCRAGQTSWYPYELLNLSVQLQFLEAAATAIDLIESKVVSPHGEQAELFLREPQDWFTYDLPIDEESTAPWQKLFKTIRGVVAEARHNPEVARSLFALASFGRRDPEFLKDLTTIFIMNGIPAEYLSH